MTITHSSPKEENKIHIWDYAAEDGDYVQILVDGVAICDPFMIKNKPIEFTVPTTGEVQILGTCDGGGGITHAVHYMNLLTSGKLHNYLVDVDKQAEDMFYRLVKEYADRQGVSEQLKSENQLEWNRKINNIQACVREVVETEIIYAI